MIPIIQFAPNYGLSPFVKSLFSGSVQGVWYDPSNMKTMWQDFAKTTPVTAVEQPVSYILDVSGNGNDAYTPAAATASRPVLSARVNLLNDTSTLSTQSVTTLATTYILSFSGSGTITLSGTKTGTYSSGSNTLSGVTAGTLTLTVSGTVNNADLRVSNDGVGLPAYQSVTNSTTYDTVGFPMYLAFNGTNSYMQTNSINFTATDKVTTWFGVRKLSDSGGGATVVAELSVDLGTNNGTFLFYNRGSGPDWRWISKGTTPQAISPAAQAAPVTNVITGIGDISAPLASIKVNGGVATTITASQGTGNYGNYALYIGQRGGSTLPFNGRIYSMIIRNKSSTAAQVSTTESYVNSKTKAY